MPRSTVFLQLRRGARAATLVVALLVAAGARGQEPSPGQAVLEGTVLGQDGKTPIEGATVALIELATGRVLRAAPTSNRGRFEISRLKSGYYDLSIQTAGGAFVASRVIEVAPSSTEKLTITLAPLDPSAVAAAAERLPDGAPAVAGEARIGERKSAGEFWGSAKGIAILAGGGAAVLLYLATSDDTLETQASPF